MSNNFNILDSTANVSQQGGVINVPNTLTNNAAASIGTLLNSPTAGNPTKWFPINDNGVTRNVPAW